MIDWDKWQERVKKIHAADTTEVNYIERIQED